MSQDSIYHGCDTLLYELTRASVIPDPDRSVTPVNMSFPTSYDLGPGLVVVPGSPPLWTPQELPIALPVDAPAVDPRTILASCPFDATLRSLQITAPDISIKDIDLATDRKNLRSLLNFFGNKTRVAQRIDAELIGGTLFFHLGWSANGYYTPPYSYGINFEKAFTSHLSEGTIQHNRVITYSFGGLRVMVKYQVDACLELPETPTLPQHRVCPETTTPSGLSIIPSGTTVAPESVIEIKTLRHGYGPMPIHPRIMEQLWFSQTPILIAGYHDGMGLFSSFEAVNVVESGALDFWQQQNTLALQKVVRLIEMIKEQLSRSPFKRQGIILDNALAGAHVTFYSLVDNYKIGLPDDLRQTLWTQT